MTYNKQNQVCISYIILLSVKTSGIGNKNKNYIVNYYLHAVIHSNI